MNELFRRNVKHHAVLIGAIGAGMFLFEVFLVWVAAQLDTGTGIEAFLTSLIPPEMRDTLFEQVGLASFPGAIAFGFQHPFPLIAGMAAVMVVATIPAAERESGFLDLVLARPVARWRYLMATAVLLAASALVLSATALAGAAVGIRVVEGYDDVVWTAYIPSAGVLAALLLAVGGYTLLLATDAPRRGHAAARAVGLTLVFYWLDFMGGLWDLLDTARWLSPFSYYNPVDGAIGDGLRWRDPVVLLTVAAVTVAGAFAHFRRQEL